MSVPNRQGEHLRKVHYGCYLLCSQAGLRISEAVSFDLTNKTKRGLYRIERPKGKKERFVYIPKQVIRELRKSNWKPNGTNRFNFYHFLRKIKRELGINDNIELSPHTLRRSFTTHHANSGMPLPLLKKLLGHSSIRTTALYWHDTDGDGDNDVPEILQVKKWLEKKKPPIMENFPETPKNSEPTFIVNEPVIPNKKPIQQDNYLSAKKVIEKIKEISINEISPSSQEKFLLNSPSKNSDQLKTSQPLAITTNKEQKPTQRELILLQKIKHLEKQLKQTQELAEKEKKRADNYQQQLKTLYQLQKNTVLSETKINNHYQQLDQEQKAQIEQPPKPPDNLRSRN